MLARPKHVHETRFDRFRGSLVAAGVLRRAGVRSACAALVSVGLLILDPPAGALGLLAALASFPGTLAVSAAAPLVETQEEELVLLLGVTLLVWVSLLFCGTLGTMHFSPVADLVLGPGSHDRLRVLVGAFFALSVAYALAGGLLSQAFRGSQSNTRRNVILGALALVFLPYSLLILAYPIAGTLCYLAAAAFLAGSAFVCGLLFGAADWIDSACERWEIRP